MALHLCYLQWLSLAKFYSLDPPTLDFFAVFHWDMSGNLINIYNLHYNIVVLKKIAKAFTNCSFRILFGQKLGQQRPCPKSSLIFFLEITRAFKNFLFHQNIISFDWVMNDFLSCVTFCCQNWPFLAESLVKYQWYSFLSG